MRHEAIEKSLSLMMVLIVVAISIGGLIEIVPLMMSSDTTEPDEGISVYSPLRLAGRDVYVREGCYNCHSQMIRPFQFGSKRTGPDLARVGGRYSDDWQRLHLMDPRALVPESNMPAYPWLAENLVDPELITTKVKALKLIGDPYTDEQIAGAAAAVEGRSELEALVAYLQGLGTNRKNRR